MQAVNKKNKLAYFENRSVLSQLKVTVVMNINVPKRNFGRNVARLYLLVETKFEQKSMLAALLLSAMILSPASTFSFCHGHFHFPDLSLRIDDIGRLFEEGKEGGPGKFMPEISMPEIRRRRQNSNHVEFLSMNLRNKRLLEVLLNLLAAIHFCANALSVQEVQTLSLVYPHRRRIDPLVVAPRSSRRRRSRSYQRPRPSPHQSMGSFRCRRLNHG